METGTWCIYLIPEQGSVTEDRLVIPISSPTTKQMEKLWTNVGLVWEKPCQGPRLMLVHISLHFRASAAYCFLLSIPSFLARARTVWWWGTKNQTNDASRQRMSDNMMPPSVTILFQWARAAEGNKFPIFYLHQLPIFLFLIFGGSLWMKRKWRKRYRIVNKLMWRKMRHQSYNPFLGAPRKERGKRKEIGTAQEKERN